MIPELTKRQKKALISLRKRQAEYEAATAELYASIELLSAITPYSQELSKTTISITAAFLNRRDLIDPAVRGLMESATLHDEAPADDWNPTDLVQARLTSRCTGIIYDACELSTQRAYAGGTAE